VVTSETAEVVVIPAFKVSELISHNADIAARVFRKAAIVVSLQLENLIRFNKEKGFYIC
jgi:hypothetical protein